MEIAITLHRDELARAVRDFLPMRLQIGNFAETDDPAWVQIDAIEEVEFMPGRGVRVRCAARVHFPLPILPDDFTVQHTVFEIVPAILAGPDGPVLAFQLDVQDLELKYLPEFVDRAVLKRLNAALVEHAGAIAWNFGKRLGRIIALPVRVQLVRTLALSAPSGAIEVTTDRILVRLSLEVAFQHEPDDAQLDAASGEHDVTANVPQVTQESA